MCLEFIDDTFCFFRQGNSVGIHLYNGVKITSAYTLFACFPSVAFASTLAGSLRTANWHRLQNSLPPTQWSRKYGNDQCSAFSSEL